MKKLRKPQPLRFLLNKSDSNTPQSPRRVAFTAQIVDDLGFKNNRIHIDTWSPMYYTKKEVDQLIRWLQSVQRYFSQKKP